MKIPVLLPNIIDHPFTYESVKKVESATTSSAYIINSNFYDKLINILKESLEKMEKEMIINSLKNTDGNITKAAENNDFIAIKTFEYTGKIFGEALANFVSFTQPEAIILTGGLVHSGKWILEPTKKSFEENLLPFYRGKVKLLTSGLEDKDSAILGSAALVWKNI